MQYRAEDFPLYLLSLAIPGVLIALTLPHWYEQVLLAGALAYLACFFLIRHGAKLESSVFRVVLQGVASYPRVLARSWRTARDAVVPIAVIFLLALAAEHFLRPALAGTKWLKPFPWQWAVWTPFLLISLFRVTIFVAHLLRASVVREVMERSPQRKTIAILPIHQHTLQAFITGMVAHLSLIAPCVLFYMGTDPSNLREALLVGGYLLWLAIAMPLRKRKLLVTPGVISNRLVYQNHTIAHQSRFYFTVFHAHHHDAIPSAMIGSAAGSGFLENVDRSFTWLDFFNSVVVLQIKWAIIIVFDMVVHQYIPGVFPFARANVEGLGHHVTHHYGSALPLGVTYRGYIERADINNGYKPDNVVTRWFLKEVEQREKLDPEFVKQFLSFYDHGTISRVASQPGDAGITAAVRTAASTPASTPAQP
jgi:hypothetical protein